MSGYSRMRKVDYAKKMGVHKSMITKYKKSGELKTVMHMGIEMVIVCPSNAKLFDNPYPTRGKKRLKKGEKADLKNK